MINPELLGYIPSVTVFEYKKLSSAKYWMNYLLPNGKRVRRPCADKRADAVRNSRIKQGQLANGIFDEYDRKKLANFLKSERKLTLEEAKELYLEISADYKLPRILKNRIK